MLNRLSYLWPYLRPHRRKLILGILAILAGVLLGLVSPLLVGKAVDAVRRRVSGAELLGYAGLVVGFSLVQGVFTYLQRMVLVAMSRDVEYDLRNVYF
ncbi:MAG TPA: ABC transporter ATP-binding protein, partial [Thermoanaerobaculia bacterium]|nr:ABC transporter ATP-binding protein [Thermoanaerobaculia bacterium]